MTALKPGRRICRQHDVILDGLTDLVVRAEGASVLDVGCNRGLAGYALACNGARLVHGIDLAPDAIAVAQGLFADLAECRGQFEVGDITRGPEAFSVFGNGGYDIVLYLGIHHKIKRPPSKPYADLGARGMNAEELSALVTWLGRKTLHYFAARIDLVDFPQLDKDLGDAGLRRIAMSEIAFGPTGIWQRESA